MDQDNGPHCLLKLACDVSKVDAADNFGRYSFRILLAVGEGLTVVVAIYGHIHVLLLFFTEELT